MIIENEQKLHIQTSTNTYLHQWNHVVFLFLYGFFDEVRGEIQFSKQMDSNYKNIHLDYVENPLN